MAQIDDLIHQPSVRVFVGEIFSLTETLWLLSSFLKKSGCPTLSSIIFWMFAQDRNLKEGIGTPFNLYDSSGTQ